MEEEYKYYVPTLEEFHVGFECQLKVSSGWDELKMDSIGMMCPMEHWIKEKQIRVKYLDKDDIESLGFYCMTSNDKHIIFGNIKYNNPHYLQRYNAGFAECVYNNLTLWLCVAVGEKTGEKQTVFAGIIKNKFELKKLMSQLGINGK